MNDFLKENLFLKERVEANIDIHPPTLILKDFQKLAKEIDAEMHFTIYGCQACTKELIMFVYDNYKEKPLLKKEKKELENEG